jgi:hypothetical protein
VVTVREKGRRGRVAVISGVGGQESRSYEQEEGEVIIRRNEASKREEETVKKKLLDDDASLRVSRWGRQRMLKSWFGIWHVWLL